MSTLMSTNSMAISLSICGDVVIAGFLNGSIMLNTLNSRDTSGKQLTTHSCPPFAITVSHSDYVCAGGCDGRVLFYNIHESGRKNTTGNRQVFEYGDSEINCISSAPSGNSVLLGSMDKIVLFNLETQVWRQNQVIELNGAYIITSLNWSKDGTKLVAGSVNGALELFSCKWKKKMIGDKLEINYIGYNQIVVKDIIAGNSALFRSKYEIKDVKIIREHFVVIWTTQTLVVGDARNYESKTSEIEWEGMVNHGVKFSFDYDNVVLINVNGELYLIELGQNQLLASVRTDFVNPHLMR